MNWYHWHTVTERLQGRAYALTRGRPYKVILDPNTSTGTCDFTNKRILINPNLFSDVFTKQGLSGKPLDKANFLVSRAVTGHEALHVVYSDPEVVLQAVSESPHLKTILNILEDARIEKIGSEQSHVSKTLFGFVNKIAAKLLSEFTDTALSDPFSCLDLLLRWRLGASIPALPQESSEKWSKIRLLANNALYAKDCKDVLGISRQILSLTGLGKSQGTDLPENTRRAIERTQSEMAGSRESQALQNPLEQNSDTGEDKPNDSGSPDSDGAITPVVPAEQEDTRHSDDSPDDVEKLVEQTAAQVSEDVDSLVPEEDGSSLIAKSTPFRGRDYPDVIASPYIHLLKDAVPIAAELTRELRSDGPRAITGPSESGGRFKTRYFVRDSTRPFAFQRFQGLTIPRMALSLVLDRSGSMQAILQDLQIMSIAITTACDNLQIPLSIWALEGQVHIKRFNERGPQVLAKIAGLHADTLTRTMPTIRDAVEELKARSEEHKQILMIHDGMPSDRSDFIEWREQVRGIGVFCLFIMDGESYEVFRQYPNRLRENMDTIIGPQHYAIAPVTAIAKHWCSYVRNIRNRYTTSVR